MTVILRPDYNMSYNERVAFKQAAVRQLRTIAQSPSVIGTAVDVRDPVVGGSAVTATQTNLPANTQAGSSNPNVDMAIEAATTTTVGWHEASPGTADNLNVMIGTTQTTMTSNKVLVVFGVQDLTVGGDLQVLQFKSNTNIKAYVDVEEMYASDVGDLIGGFFVDSDSGAPAGVYYGTVINQPMNIQGMWHTNVAKNTKLRALVAETQGTVITTKTAGVS